MKEYLLLVPNKIKNSVIKEVRKKYYNINIKFLSLEEFIKKMTFDYDDKTIYYLMKKYNIKYSTASVYLDNLYYIGEDIENSKMDKLKEIKGYLDDNNLLIYDSYFKKGISNKEIYIYGYDYITKYQRKVLKGINYKEIKWERKKYELKKIYYAPYIEDEVIFVIDQISKLLKDGIDINNIKVIASSEYKEVLGRIFDLYHIPFNIKKNSLYSTYTSKLVLNNLNDLDSILNIMEDVDIHDKIIKILNKYVFIENKNEVKELIERDFKNTYLNKRTKNSIELITLNDHIDDDDYVFLMGFNKENFPIVHKDCEYFNDKEREILGLDTSISLNDSERKKIVQNILEIKNLTVTYKLFDSSTNYTKSDLFENICVEEIKNNDFSNSHMMNKIYLTKKLDSLVKYNIKEDNLDLLYSNYYGIPYMKYDNSYKQITKEKVYEYLDNKLLLAYSSLDNYNRCKFKYYLSNILKINLIKNDFAIIIGEVCHYVLSKMDEENFDTTKYFDNYLKEKREFTSREKFFLDNVKEELIFIIDTIRKQMTYTTFDKKMYEKKVCISKDKNIKVTFMGVIDKILYHEEEGITYLVVIDYKTGNTSIKLDNIKYGIDMQLPIYLYLSSNLEFKNVYVVGFYLQKLLNSNLDNTKDYETARENNLKLEGYSTDNVEALSRFDTTYNDSKLIKSMKTSKNGFYSYSKVLSSSSIDNLINETNNVIDENVESIINADFTIDPKVIDGDNVSCRYCEFKDICFKKEKDLVYINRENDSEEEKDGIF